MFGLRLRNSSRWAHARACPHRVVFLTVISSIKSSSLLVKPLLFISHDIGASSKVVGAHDMCRSSSLEHTPKSSKLLLMSSSIQTEHQKPNKTCPCLSQTTTFLPPYRVRKEKTRQSLHEAQRVRTSTPHLLVFGLKSKKSTMPG